MENHCSKGGIVDFVDLDVDQLNQILSVCGTPDDETLERLGSARAQVYIRSLPPSPKVPFSRIFPNASPVGILN